MFKWDRISWIATGIFILGIVLGSVVHEAFLFLIVVAYLLRTGLIAFGAGRNYADERQLQVQFHSGNIAFIVVVIGIIACAVRETLAGRPADIFNELLSVALVTKAVVGLVMYGDYGRTALRISVFIGLLYLLFVVASHGFALETFIEGAPGLVILGAGVLGKKYPIAGGIVFSALGLATLYVFGIFGGLTESRFMVSLVLSLPLLVVAFCFIMAARSPTE